MLLWLVWFGGFAAVLVRWWLSSRRVHAAAQGATRMKTGREIEALRRIERRVGMRHPISLLYSAGSLEPGIVGIFHPALLWPATMTDHLSDAQLDAIIAHEVCHVRRRDNLLAMLHMFVEAVFWFHPLIWWLGTRLIDEREKACDEEVLRMGSEPKVYADSILKACRYYLEAPQMSMAGVTGSDLKQRIERIMTPRIGRPLDFGRKLLLCIAGSGAIAGPLLFGVAQAPAVRAQSPTSAPPAFEVASIKPNKSGDGRTMFNIAEGGRVVCTNIGPKMLILMAYDLKPNQLVNAPNWIDTERYDITAKAEGPADPDQLKLMMRTLLADRFKLAIHRETKEMAIYELVAAKGGTKLKASAETSGKNRGMFRMGRGMMQLDGATMAQMADNLSRVVGRNVYDKTGLSGAYDVKLEWTPDESEAAMFKGPPDGREGPATAPESGPSLTAALEEQLGLKLQPAKGPVEVVVIDHIEKASEN